MSYANKPATKLKKLRSGQAVTIQEANKEFQRQRDEMTTLKGECKQFGNEVRQESQGIKSVVTNVSASHGQELGAVRQRLEQIEATLKNMGGNTGGGFEGKGGDNIMGLIPVKEMMPKVYGGKVGEWRDWERDMSRYLQQSVASHGAAKHHARGTA